MESSNNKDFWEKKWSINKPAFHNENTSYALEKFGTKLFDSAQDVFVPLCGKSLDLIYLKNKVKSVTGIEMIEKAIIQFFNENDLKFEKLKNTFTSENLEIIHGDIFKIKNTKKFDAILDRASMIALPFNQRKNYCQILSNLLNPEGILLLTTINKDEVSGLLIW